VGHFLRQVGHSCLTASTGSEATHARAGRSGAVGYLRKPFEESALLDAIERAIGKADQS